MTLEQWACAAGGDEARCPSYPWSLPHIDELGPDADLLDHVGRACQRCGRSLVACFRLGCGAPVAAFVELMRGPVRSRLRYYQRPGRDMEVFGQDVVMRVLDRVAVHADFDPLGDLRPLGQWLGAAVGFAARDVNRELRREEARERQRSDGTADIERGSRSAPPTVEEEAVTVSAAELREAFALVQIVLDEFPPAVRPEFEAWMGSVRTGGAHGAVADAARAVHGIDDNTTRKRVGRHVEDVVARVREVFSRDLYGDNNAALRLLMLWGIALDDGLDSEPGWRDEDGEGGAA